MASGRLDPPQPVFKLPGAIRKRLIWCPGPKRLTDIRTRNRARPRFIQIGSIASPFDERWSPMGQACEIIPSWLGSRAARLEVLQEATSLTLVRIGERCTFVMTPWRRRFN